MMMLDARVWASPPVLVEVALFAVALLHLVVAAAKRRAARPVSELAAPLLSTRDDAYAVVVDDEHAVKKTWSKDVGFGFTTQTLGCALAVYFLFAAVFFAQDGGARRARKGRACCATRCAASPGAAPSTPKASRSVAAGAGARAAARARGRGRVAFLPVVAIFGDTHNVKIGRRLGVRARAYSRAASSTPWRAPCGAAEPGVVTNLVSVDAANAVNYMVQGQLLWAAALQLTLNILLLLDVLGAAGLFGVGVLVALMPASRAMKRRLARLQTQLMAKRDGRMRVIHEVIAGIRVLLHRDLTAAQAFTALTLFNLLRWPLNALPDALNYWIQAKVAFARFEAFIRAAPAEAGAAARDAGDIALAGTFSWPGADSPRSKSSTWSSAGPAHVLRPDGERQADAAVWLDGAAAPPRAPDLRAAEARRGRDADDVAPGAAAAKTAAADGRLVRAEAQQVGATKLAVYGRYFVDCGGASFLVPMAALLVGYQVLLNGQALALKAWVAALELENSGAAQRSKYVFFASATFGTLCLTRLAIAKGSLRGSRKVHDRVVAAVLAAPLAWFEATPAGRVLNRCASDVQTIDKDLMNELAMLAQYVLSLAGIVAVILYEIPVAAASVAPMVGFSYVFAGRYYACERRRFPPALSFRSVVPAGNRELKRLEALGVTQAVTFTIKQHATVEMAANALERADEYARLPRERADGRARPPGWPAKGRVAFEAVARLRVRAGRAGAPGRPSPSTAASASASAGARARASRAWWRRSSASSSPPAARSPTASTPRR
ncbi:ATPase [Aureococcus anophagefferens]|nr:ATPase [Aureococcus anophagefferens]